MTIPPIVLSRDFMANFLLSVGLSVQTVPRSLLKEETTDFRVVSAAMDRLVLRKNPLPIFSAMGDIRFVFSDKISLL
jgi:hypothetical protein